MGNIVAIVGRPNVGKSTFFNRLIKRREAIVDAVSGVTRDRHYGKSDWNGQEFSLIDTGGYILGSDDIFESEIDKQVELAIDEADAIVFMVDVETGITGMDEDVARLLRKVKKPVFLVVNKVDNAKREQDAVEFYNLGLGNYYTIASINGSGTGDLLDALVESLPNENSQIVSDLPRFAVVGRPNAGKSSFINYINNKEVSIVTNIPGTTTDLVSSTLDIQGDKYTFIDTAGIRKYNNLVEKIGIERSLESAEKSDLNIVFLKNNEKKNYSKIKSKIFVKSKYDTNKKKISGVLAFHRYLVMELSILLKPYLQN